MKFALNDEEWHSIKQPGHSVVTGKHPKGTQMRKLDRTGFEEIIPAVEARVAEHKERGFDEPLTLALELEQIPLDKRIIEAFSCRPPNADAAWSAYQSILLGNT